MNPDGVSYLDIGDAYFRGDFRNAVNAVWSPLYSWILGLTMMTIKPSSFEEFTVVHIINFLIYLFALGSFQFFLSGLIKLRESLSDEPHFRTNEFLPQWALISLTFLVFLWGSLDLISIRTVSPD